MSGPTTPNFPRDSPTARDNPMYFDFGVFSDPSTSGYVTNEEALTSLSDVSRNLKAKVGSRRKRVSLKEFLTNSLSRRRSSAKKDRTQSCSGMEPDEDEDIEGLTALARSTSLDPADVTVAADMSREDVRQAVNSPRHNYYNESHQAVVQDRPPRPPERNHYSQLRKDDQDRPQRMGLEFRSPGGISEQVRNSRRNPRIPHRVCKREVYTSASEAADVVIVHSAECRVSADWCGHLGRLFASDPRQFRVSFQSVETLGRLGDGDEEELERRQEITFHARAQLLLLSAQFLDWVWLNPSFILGTLLVPKSLLVLLLGIDASAIREEHRASFVTSRHWRTVFVDNTPQHCFAEKIYADVVSMLCHTKIKSSRALPPSPMQVKPNRISILRRTMFLFPSEKMSNSSVKARVRVTFEDGKRRIVLAEESVHWLSDHVIEVSIPTEVFSGLNLPKVIHLELLISLDNDEAVVLGRGSTIVENWLDDLRTGLESLPSVTDVICANSVREADELDSVLKHLAEVVFGYRRQATVVSQKQNGSLMLWAERQGPERLSNTLQHCYGNDDLSAVPDDLSVEKEATECSRSTSTPEMQSHHLASKARRLQQQQQKHPFGVWDEMPQESHYDIPRPSSQPMLLLPNNDEHRLPSKEISYIPMQAAAAAALQQQQQHTNLKRRSWSSLSGGYVPPMNPVASSPTAAVVSSTDSSSTDEELATSRSQLSFLIDSAVRPQSRQEIEKFCETKGSQQHMEMDRVEKEAPLRNELTEMRGFDPVLPNMGIPRRTPFEECQAELIELHDLFKRQILTLGEVEEKFEAWKRRPELDLAYGKRQEEKEMMRDEWLRLQTLSEAKSRKEGQVLSLLRGLIRRKTTSSSSGEESLLVNSPERNGGGYTTTPRCRAKSVTGVAPPVFPKTSVPSSSFCNSDYDVPRRLSLHGVGKQVSATGENQMMLKEAE